MALFGFCLKIAAADSGCLDGGGMLPSLGRAAAEPPGSAPFLRFFPMMTDRTNREAMEERERGV